MKPRRDRAAIQAEALHRATTGQSLTNYVPIIQGFTEKGIPADDIRPRENVFTFNAWRELGRTVRRGEHGVKVLTYITTEPNAKDRARLEQAGQPITPARRPWTTTVFHVSQTEALQSRPTEAGQP
jgi:hypothetical protein